MRRSFRNIKSASVVIPTCNEGEMLHMTVESIINNSGSIPFEVIVVDDGSTDGSCDCYRNVRDSRVRVIEGEQLGVARARNYGARAAQGDMLVFLDAHCEVSSHWLDRLAQAMYPFDVALVSPTFTKLREHSPVGLGIGWANRQLENHWYEPLEGRRQPYEIPLACGACQAFPADVFHAIGMFEEGFTRWGYEDIEIGLRSWMLGYRVMGEPTTTIAHWFRETRNYNVDEVKVIFNFLRMIRMHLSDWHCAQIVEVVKPMPGFDQAMEMLVQSDTEQLRAELFAVRERDDNWFCNTFFPNLFQPERKTCHCSH